MTGLPSPAHVAMRELLDQMRWTYVEEGKIAGHRIDFVLPDQAGGWEIGVDVNGDRWHRWSKIRECDRVKLNRVFAEPYRLVLGVWWSRLRRNPSQVEAAIRMAVQMHRLWFWDWAVPIESLEQQQYTRVSLLRMP